MRMRNQHLVLPTSVTRPRRSEHPDTTRSSQHHHDLVAGRYDSAEFRQTRSHRPFVRTASLFTRRWQFGRAIYSRDLSYAQGDHAAMPLFEPKLGAVHIVNEAGSVLTAGFLGFCDVPTSEVLNTKRSPSRT